MEEILSYPYMGYLFKIFLSIICAFFIGLERERKAKAAGLKTHILISVGSTVFTIVGSDYIEPGSRGEFLRVFQGIITGVGFVGAGAIIREGVKVKGLTTAAGIWFVAAIGLAIGAGDYPLAIIGTLSYYFIMLITRSVEKRIKKKV